MSDAVPALRPAASLEDSSAITREAIAALVSAPLPKTLEIDGRSLALEGTSSGARLSVKLSWPRGSMRLRVGLQTASNERRNPEDHGHRQSLQVWSEDGSREMAWNGLEWFVRDAIREGRPAVPVEVWTAFMERGAAEEATGIGNGELGRRARELLSRSGLGGGSTARLEIGAYDLATRRWVPDASLVLQRLLTLAAVKTVLRDRGRGTLIEGEAPFPIRAGKLDTQPSVADGPPPGDRLTGVNLWFGASAGQVEGVRDALRFIVDELPTTPELEAWIREQGELTSTRIDVYTRLLLQLGFATRDESDHWTGTDLGAELVESEDADIIYRAFVAHYVGFEETLAFFGRHPEAEREQLLFDLVRRLGVDWKATAQASRRASWLHAMGLLEGERGLWKLSPKGHAVFAKLPQELHHDLDVETPSPEPGNGDQPVPQTARLVAEDVPLGDLQLDATLLAKCVAALNARKHLLLVGAPGTGKSAIGSAIARHAADVYGLNAPVLATASADWTAYDTIGGWTQRADQRLAFRPGVLTRAIGERRWLVLDELNRADVDKCLGEAFTVLAGGEAETAFTNDDGTPVRIGAGSTYDPGDWFRVIATMNVRDKATLFRLSYALLRRFAIIEVPVPSDETILAIARADGARMAIPARFADLAASCFARDGLGEVVELGPAMLRDVLAYAKQRGPSEVAVAEGVELFVLPQLDGLETGDAKRARSKLSSLFGSDAAARDLVVRRFESYFPHVRFDG